MKSSIGSYLNRVQSLIDLVCGYISFGIVLLMMFATAIDVLFRYALNRPLPGVVELQVMFLIALIYIGLPYIQSLKANICLDILVTRMKPVTQSFLSIVGWIICIIGFGLLSWRSGVAAYRSTVMHEYVEGLINYPIAPAKWAIAIGSGLFVLRCLTDVIEGLRGINAMRGQVTRSAEEPK